MSDAKRYRQYAKDCMRIAEKMDAKDKQTLLQVAEAWEMRAREAERKESRSTER